MASDTPYSCDMVFHNSYTITFTFTFTLWPPSGGRADLQLFTLTTQTKTKT